MLHLHLTALSLVVSFPSTRATMELLMDVDTVLILCTDVCVVVSVCVCVCVCVSVCVCVCVCVLVCVWLCSGGECSGVGNSAPEESVPREDRPVLRLPTGHTREGAVYLHGIHACWWMR